ncbi:MAG: hypothetical protein Q4C77_06880 [Eubacteriales bacterium]|nr:hypothetical protein [Eubacteriales bacterium]
MAEIIFSKYSNERCRRFAIRTDILEKNGVRYVEKHAMYPEGKAHVEGLADWYRKLSVLYREISLAAGYCEKTEDGVRLDYIPGETLEEQLDSLLHEEKQQEAGERLKAYLSQVESLYQKADFVQTEQFQQVFGRVSLPEGLKCGGTVTNIDMVCANVILGEIPTILDYEWTFDFPIPCKFVLYRIIHYYTATNGIRMVLHPEQLYHDFGITGDLLGCFAEMEQNFQNYITGSHTPIREMFADITPGIVREKAVYDSRLQVFLSMDGMYREEDSRFYPMNEGRAMVQIPLPEGCRWIRLDPGDQACVVHIERMTFDGREVSLKGEQIPGGTLRGQWAFIPHLDPAIKGIPVPEGAKVMEVCLTTAVVGEDLIGIVCKANEENEYLHNKVHRMNQIIDEMKNTKIWKLYGKYRNAVERKR